MKDGFYQPHPDPNQERLFFSLLREMLEKGIVDVAMVEREMALNHVRHDGLDVVPEIGSIGSGGRTSLRRVV